MAAPSSTFRLLARWGCWVPGRAWCRGYGGRTSATGELVTHTGQVMSPAGGGDVCAGAEAGLLAL